MNNLLIISSDKPLDCSYVPSCLIITYSDYKEGIELVSYVYDSFLKLKEEAKKNGFLIDIMSGYRSYNYQKIIYNKLIHDKGISYAFMRIAPPGASEHQSGLAIDFCVYKNNKCFVESEIIDLEETNWVHKNMYKYGFILRYPPDKEDITGFVYEPWHIRYVGNDAINIYKRGICLEEYIKE